MKPTLLLIVLILAACEITTEPDDAPEYTNTVTGYALTTDSLDPIPNLVLRMNPVHGHYTTPVGGKTVRTDSTGQFTFIYTGPAHGRIGIGFSGNGAYHNLGGYDYITPYTTRSHNIQLQPYGWLKLYVKNVNPWNGDDVIGVSTGGGGQYLIEYGLADKTVHFKKPGNGHIHITWTVERNGVETDFADSVYILGFDTTFYQILY